MRRLLSFRDVQPFRLKVNGSDLLLVNFTACSLPLFRHDVNGNLGTEELRAHEVGGSLILGYDDALYQKLVPAVGREGRFFLHGQ